MLTRPTSPTPIGDVSQTPSRAPLRIAAVAAFVAIAVVLALGRHVYHVADDFCFIGELPGRGAWDYVVFWWQSWSGRWAASLFRYAYYELTELTASPWLAPFMLACVFGAAALLAASLYGWSRDVAAGALAAGSLMAFASSQPSDLLFWAPGGFDWTLGYVFVAAFALFTLRLVTPSRRGALLVTASACLSAVVAAGFGETLALVPLALAAVVIMAVPSCRNPRFLAVAASAAVGLAINLASPGSDIRREGLDIDIEFGEWLWNALLNGSRVVLPTIVILAAMSAHPAVGAWLDRLGARARSRLPRALLVMLAIVVIAYPYVTSAALYWSLESAGPGRARGFCVLLLIVAWPLIFSLRPRPCAGAEKRGARRAVGYVLPALAVLLLSAINVPGYYEDLAAGRAAAAHRQALAQDALLGAAAPSDSVELAEMTANPHALRIRRLERDPGYWVNACTARAWDVKSVRAAVTRP